MSLATAALPYFIRSNRADLIVYQSLCFAAVWLEDHIRGAAGRNPKMPVCYPAGNHFC